MEKGEELAETKMKGSGGRIKGSKPESRLSDVCEGLCRLFFQFQPFANHRYLSSAVLLIQTDQRSVLSFSNFNHNHQTLSVDVLLVEKDQSQPPAGHSSDTTGSKLRDTCWESLKFLKCYCFFSFKILLGPCLNIGAKRKSVKSGGERGCDGV